MTDEMVVMTDSRTDGFRSYEADFETLRRLAYQGEPMPDNADLCAISAFQAAEQLYSLHRSGLLDPEVAKRRMKIIFNEYVKLRKQADASARIYRAQQESIKRSSKLLSRILNDCGSVSEREMLSLCVEYICCENGEYVTLDTLRKKLGDKSDARKETQ